MKVLEESRQSFDDKTVEQKIDVLLEYNAMLVGMLNEVNNKVAKLEAELSSICRETESMRGNMHRELTRIHSRIDTIRRHQEISRY